VSSRVSARFESKRLEGEAIGSRPGSGRFVDTWETRGVGVIDGTSLLNSGSIAWSAEAVRVRSAHGGCNRSMWESPVAELLGE